MIYMYISTSFWHIVHFMYMDIHLYMYTIHVYIYSIMYCAYVCIYLDFMRYSKLSTIKHRVLLNVPICKELTSYFLPLTVNLHTTACRTSTCTLYLLTLHGL